MTDLLPLVKDIGFPAALCIVLLYAIRHMAQTLVKAYTDRIKALEGAFAEMRTENTQLRSELLRRTDQQAHEIKAIAGQYARVVQDHDAWTKQAFSVLSRLIDSWQTRPCLYRDHQPHPAPEAGQSATRRKPPSSDDLAAPPEPPSERTSR